MSEGCTDCGRKGGCDHRKAGMFTAIDEALARLYPTGRWDERDEAQAFRGGVPPGTGERLADLVAPRLGAMALYQPGSDQDWCDWVYVLCLGRAPSIVEIRAGLAAPESDSTDELYLRVALSHLAPFAAVQQVAMRMVRDGDRLTITEVPRTGVFDPILLPRFAKLVAALVELDLRHLDFGDLTNPPAQLHPGDYADRYGGAPTVANYLFFPQPAASTTATVVELSRAVASG